MTVTRLQLPKDLLLGSTIAMRYPVIAMHNIITPMIQTLNAIAKETHLLQTETNTNLSGSTPFRGLSTRPANLPNS